jgi:hypothetical protein
MSLSKRILYDLNVTGGKLLSNDMNVSYGTVSNIYMGNVSGGSMTLSGDLSVSGTLTTVNITTANISETNVSASSIVGTNVNITNATIANIRNTNVISINNTITNSIITNLSAGSVIVSGNSTFGSNVVVAGPVLQIPTGNISSRPTANLGYIRYNTETSQFEGYGHGNAWGSLGGVVDIAQTTKVLASANPSVTDGNLYFFTIGTERVRINSAGNVGIATTAPAHLLDVNGGLRSTNFTTTNALSTNVSTASLNASTGITAASAQITNINATTVTIATLLNTNAVSTNVSTASLNASTGITAASAQITNINATTVTIATLLNTNAVSTNISTATLNASTGITAASAQITNTVSTNISAGTVVATTYTGGSLSLSGAVTAVTGTIGTFVATTSSTGTAVATTYTGGSMSLSGNLSIGGTITTVNITTTNISQTNVSAGTVSATNIAVTTETVGTSRITTSLLALGNSNTVGNVFTTGGNVGIATTSPGSALHVAGAMPISPIGVGIHMGIDLSTYAQIQLNSTIGSYIDFSTSGGDYYSRILGSNNGDIYISTNGGSNNRYVGINTVSPAYTLDVTGTGRFTGNVSTSTITVNGTGVSSLAVGASTSANAQSLIVQNSFGSTEIGVAHVVGSYSSNAIAGDSIIRSSTSKNLLLQSGIGNVSVYIAASGNVGIATANPAVPLHVSNSTGNTMRLQNASSTSNACLELQNDNSTSFIGLGSSAYGGTLQNNLFLQSPKSTLFNVNGGTTAIFINTSGNVGIGTTSPGYTLDVNGTSRLNGGSGGTTSSLLFSGIDDGGNNRLVFSHSSTSQYQKIALQSRSLGAPNSGRANFHVQVNTANDTSNASISDTRLFIDGLTGNIGIGTTNPSLAFHVKASNVGDTMILENSSATGYATMQFKTPSQTFFIGLGGASEAQNTYRDKLYILNTSSNGIVLDTNGYVGIGTKSPSALFQVNTNSTVLMQLNTAGRLSVLDDVIAFASFSDSRLKTDIETVSEMDAVDVVNALRPVTFKWRDTISNIGKRGVSDIGFIAQEVEQIAPYTVEEFQDMADNVEYKRIKHERLLPYLVASIQHLTRRLNEKCNCCCKCDKTE